MQTCDIVPGAANVPGCQEIEDWMTAPCDFLVPCANSLAITEEVAKNFPEGLKHCTGATNSPFATDNAKEIFEELKERDPDFHQRDALADVYQRATDFHLRRPPIELVDE